MKPSVTITAPTFRLVKTREAARILGISERKLWSLRNTGEIPAVKFGCRAVRYNVLDLQAWAERHTERGRANHT